MSGAPEVDLTGDLAPLEEVVRAEASQASVAVGADGSVIGRFQPEQTFIPVRAGDIPATIEAAVLGAEDPTFHEHHGIEPRAIVRAASQNLAAGTVVEGGSTITQQIAKNLYTDGKRTLARKLREAAIARELEDRYSKDELLAAYLNTAYFGNGAIGIVAAARVYFGKELADVTLSEAALLAGLIASPSSRNPRTNPEVAETQRLAVLERVAEHDLAPAAQVREARAAPPKLVDPPPTDSPVPYALDYVRRWLAQHADISASDLHGGGYRIETTIDPSLQQRSQEHVAAMLADPNGPTAALVVMDHRTGYVRAAVGGTDWTSSKVNLALGRLGAGTGRQPGSSFKPFVLAAALAGGAHPDTRVPAPKEYQPAGADKPVFNYSQRGYGELSLTDATVRSVNTAYTIVTELVGPKTVRDLASRLGIDGLPDWVGPSIGIGAYETSPLDMAQAYSAFPRDGRTVEPTPVLRVIAPNGEVVVDNTTPAPGEQVLEPKIARNVTAILEQVVRRGTGTRANIGRPVTGKTGTSNEYANAWFVGYTNQLTAAVWVGFPQGNVPMRGLPGWGDVTGGSIPAQLWHDVMLMAHEGLPVEGFAPAPPLPKPPDPTPPPGAREESTPPPRDGGGGGGGGHDDGDDDDGPGRGNGRKGDG